MYCTVYCTAYSTVYYTVLSTVLYLQANQVSRGDWSSSTNLFTDLGESLVGKTVGFIGLGRIGLAVAERLLPFKINPKIFYCNRTENIQAAKYYSTVLKRNSFDGEF